MKIALIGAPNTFEIMRNFGFSYHLVLAQCLADKMYIDYYQRAVFKGDFIIMDNGAAETGVAGDLEFLLEVWQKLGADEFVMPDVLDDCDLTLERTEAACPAIPINRRMMVPQGRDWKEWESCLEEMLDMGCASIAIAKRYERLEGGRVRAIKIIRSHDVLYNHHIHLLGCNNAPTAEAIAALKEYPGIRGIDTAAPFAYAQKGVHLNKNVNHHASYEWGEPFDPQIATSNIYNFWYDTR